MVMAYNPAIFPNAKYPANPKAIKNPEHVAIAAIKILSNFSGHSVVSMIGVEGLTA